MRWSVAVAAAVAGLVLLSAADTDAAPLPRTDCGAGAPETGAAALHVGIWFGGDLEDWIPPRCTGWSAQQFTVLVETAGATHLTGRADDILARLARISDLTTIRYWSTTRDRWRPLIPDAAALEAPDPDRRRGDFTAADLRAGPVFFWQEENTPLDEVTYRMTVREADADTVVVEISNALAARAGPFERVPPGHHTFFYRFDRREDGAWTLYGLMRSGSGPRLIARVGRKSYGNRAVALFRYLAGQVTDGAPPVYP